MPSERDEPLSISDRDYCGRLADFIIDHIGKPYTAEECGRVLEVPLSDSDPVCPTCGRPVTADYPALRAWLLGNVRVGPALPSCRRMLGGADTSAGERTDPYV